MAGRKAGFAHVSDVGVWVSASPRVLRVVGAHVALVLIAGLAAVAAHRPGSLQEPLRLAAALEPVDVATAAPSHPPDARRARVEVSRSRLAPRARPKPHPARKAKAAPPTKGWSYYAPRIRGCESHGRPDAPADYQAQNPATSASGAYQIVDATWGGRYGVQHASDATPEQQDAVAAELYRRHGTADWAASAPCWR